MDHGGWVSYGFELGARLKRLRTMRGLSQQRLAELAGVSRNVISNLERNEGNAGTTNNPSLLTVYRLAQALLVPPAVLLPAATQISPAVCPRSTSLKVELEWPTCNGHTTSFSSPTCELGGD